ncbi:MAG: hypothetical protein J6386_15250 [Candidatus Synoicihabitans palmerolidicus]|nr:hypothetical protein [Candidatus Synoicihabitans palmerolidicus]
MHLGKTHPVDVPVCGEIGRTMTLLSAAFLAGATREGTEAYVAARW